MMYDPTEDIYHLMYQWHPYHVNWGKSIGRCYMYMMLTTHRKHLMGACDFKGSNHMVRCSRLGGKSS
jgi:hypothetical protein